MHTIESSIERSMAFGAFALVNQMRATGPLTAKRSDFYDKQAAIAIFSNLASLYQQLLRDCVPAGAKLIVAS